MSESAIILPTIAAVFYRMIKEYLFRLNGEHSHIVTEILLPSSHTLMKAFTQTLIDRHLKIDLKFFVESYLQGTSLLESESKK